VRVLVTPGTRVRAGETVVARSGRTHARLSEAPTEGPPTTAGAAR
jgi:hypothetical protein